MLAACDIEAPFGANKAIQHITWLGTLESFFATLKNEVHYRRSFPTRDSAKHAVIEFIEVYYNRRRPHSTIGYKMPAEAMEEFFERTAPKPEVLPMAT